MKWVLLALSLYARIKYATAVVILGFAIRPLAVRQFVVPLQINAVQRDTLRPHPRSEWYELMEDAVKFRDGSIISLLWWKNEKQIIDLMDDD
jgi:hypothetical protein